MQETRLEKVAQNLPASSNHYNPTTMTVGEPVEPQPSQLLQEARHKIQDAR